MNIRVHVHQHPFRRKSLGIVRGHARGRGRSASSCLVEGDSFFFVAIHPNGDPAVLTDLLDGSQVTIGNAQLSRQRYLLQPASDIEFSFDLAVCGNHNGCADPA